MGQSTSFPPAKLIIGTILAPECPWEEVEHLLRETFGDPDFVSPELPFAYTDYYHAEMGKPLRRCFATISGLWASERLPEAKIATNSLEGPGPRRFNLDPGLLTLHSLILASTKPHAHRIPLHSGIYAEVTLIYREGGYQALPWTYPDYAGDDYQPILLEIRENLKSDLK